MGWLRSWFLNLFNFHYVEYDPEADVLDRGSEQFNDLYINWKQYKNKITFEAYFIADGKRVVKLTLRRDQPITVAPDGEGPTARVINRFITIFNQINKG